VLHHLTLWVPSIERAAGPWGWLLGELGFRPAPTDRPEVLLFRQDGFALVLEQSADMVPGMLHSRLRPGLNHLAFQLPVGADPEAVVAQAVEQGWNRLAAGGHPIAAGAAVAFLEDADGFEVELVSVGDDGAQTG
jgi:catechol 2,3-dioxygenase-like lactoylglutathione lyase family enzyme